MTIEKISVKKGIRFNPPHHTKAGAFTQDYSQLVKAREAMNLALGDKTHLAATKTQLSGGPSLSSVDSKGEISESAVMNRHNSDNSPLGARSIDVSEEYEPTPSNYLRTLLNAFRGQMSGGAETAFWSLFEELQSMESKTDIEPTSQHIQQLEEQHCKDTETIAQLESDNECLQKRLKGAIARSDENRSETLHEQNKRREEGVEADNRYNALVLETNRRIEKLERSHEIEVRNLQNDIQVQNKALEKHAEDEQLIGMLLRKAGSYAERFAD